MRAVFYKKFLRKKVFSEMIFRVIHFFLQTIAIVDSQLHTQK